MVDWGRIAGSTGCETGIWTPGTAGRVAESLEKETGRVEAFSDGVFAIAITLLVLEFKVPHLPAGASGRDLFLALLDLWPSMVAFLGSFAAILIMWMTPSNTMNSTTSALMT